MPGFSTFDAALRVLGVRHFTTPDDIADDLETGTVSDPPHIGTAGWETAHGHTTLAHKVFGMHETGRVSFLVCIVGYWVEWSGGRRRFP